MLIAMWGMSALGKHEHLDSRPDRGINNLPVDYEYVRLS